MKRTNVIYWTSTGLFCAFMLFSAIPDLLVVPEAVEFVSGKLGYPEYFIAFIGAAKILGVIGILLPGFPRVTEWAYAGMFFDLMGASYSGIMVDGFQPEMLMMVVVVGVMFLSYTYYQKRRKEAVASPAFAAA